MKMAEDAKKQALKDEAEDDFDGPILGLNRKVLRKELIPKDEVDEDDAPLSLSKTSKKKSSVSPKVKKQEAEDEEDNKPLKKKEVLKNNSKTKNVKMELDSEGEEDEKPLKKSKKRKRMEEKETVRKVKKSSVSVQKVKNTTKQKKVYELPGQKHDPPEMRDPLRIFYETLYEKVPTSEMAATWLMERGLLPLEEAQKVYAKKLKKHHVQKFGSLGKVTPRKKSPAISIKKEVKVTSQTTTKKIKKKVNDSETDEDDDDDFDFIKKKTSNKKSGTKKKN